MPTGGTPYPGDTISESKGGGNIFSDKGFQKFTQSC